MLNRILRSVTASVVIKPGVCWFLCFATAGGALLYHAAGVTGEQSSGTPAAFPSAPDSTASRRIEDIRVGQRVVTPGTRSGENLATAVDPATWKLIRLRVDSKWEDGTPDTADISTLQPPGWMAAQQAAVGSSVQVPIDLHEMGLVPHQARVMAVEPCPTISSGAGRVVLTTITHLNKFVFQLTVRDAAGAQATVGVTGYHKVFSVTRGLWVSAWTLTAGETVRGRGPPLAVVSLLRDPAVERVYNMTVEGEHQYYVSPLGLLAHNANCTGSYTIKFKSGKTYSGKGPRERMRVSAGQKTREYKDPAVSMDWTPAANEEDAYVQEALRIRANGGSWSPNNYNLRSSPGEAILRSLGL